MIDVTAAVIKREGNILMSFNNYPLQKAIPFMENILPALQLNLKQLNLNNDWKIDENLQFEFTPSPEETELIIKEKESAIDFANSENNALKQSLTTSQN